MVVLDSHDWVGKNQSPR